MADGNVTIWFEGRIEDVARLARPDGTTAALLSVTCRTRAGRRRITLVAEGDSHAGNIARHIGTCRDALIRATPADHDGCDLVAQAIAFDPSHRTEPDGWLTP